MADFGLSVYNNSNSVIISSIYKVMVFSERGSFYITSRYNDVGGSGGVYFTKVITTQEPPQIFLGNLSGQHARVSLYTTLIGGPGNWTGFLVNSAVAGGNLQNTYVEYVACKYADQANTDPYGLNIWDGSGRIVYSSKDRIVRYSKFAKAWSDPTNGSVSGGAVYTYMSNVALDADDFICVSAIDRGPTWCAGFQFVGLTILDNWVPSLYMTTNRAGGGDRLFQGTNNCNLCIPICKFPISRYNNT